MGHGFQFNVYDQGNRVLKIPRSIFAQTLISLRWGFIHPSYFLFWKRVSEANSNRLKSIMGITKKRLNIKMLGNPVFEGQKIWQVIPLKELIGENSESLFKKYAEFTVNCWRYGFQDRVFNFGQNNGLDKDGKIVLIDLGELSFDKVYIKNAILNQRWKKCHDYKYLLNSNQKKIFHQIMISSLNPKRIDTEWLKLVEHN